MEPIKKSVNDYDNDTIKEEKLIKTNKVKIKYFFETLQQIFKFPGWNKEECTENKVNAIFLKEFTKLVYDYENRMKAYKNDIKVLGKGFWYKNDYLLALEETNQSQSIKWHKERNSFYHGLAPKGFAHDKNKNGLTGFSICSYVLKQEIAPSIGLNNCISSKPCFIDCQMLIEIALYKTILKVIGTAAFNSYFKKNPLRLDLKISATPLEKFIQSSESIFPGVMGFFANTRPYTLKHPDGQYGFHALYKGENKFMAFGQPAEGINEEEIFKYFLDRFNSSPLDSKRLYTKDFAEKTKMQTIIQAGKVSPNPEKLLAMLNSLTSTVEQFKNIQNDNLMGLVDSTIKKINVLALKELCVE